MKAPEYGGFLVAWLDNAKATLRQHDVQHFLKVVEELFFLELLRDFIAGLARANAKRDRDGSLTVVNVSVDVGLARDNHVDDVDSLRAIRVAPQASEKLVFVGHGSDDVRLRIQPVTGLERHLADPLLVAASPDGVRKTEAELVINERHT